MKMVVLLLYLNILGPLAWCWTPKDAKLYNERHFIELKHLLVVQNKTKFRHLIELQEKDLLGCKAIHFGNASPSDFITCVRFLNRERELQLFTPGRGKIIEDLNILCKSLFNDPQIVKKALQAKIFKNDQKDWKTCQSEAWRQVYLTVYANFDADPIESLALLRKAQTNLTLKTSWANKALAFISSKPGAERP